MNDDDRPEFYRDFFPLQPDRPTTPPPHVNGNAASGGYGLAALQSEVDTLATTPNGRRNDQLNVAAFNLAQLVASGHLELHTTRTTLHQTALAIGLTDTETERTLDSAFGAGMDQPRVVIQHEGVTIDAPAATVFTPGEPEGAHADAPRTLREEFPAIDWPTLWEDEDEVPWLVEPLIPARRLVALFSPAKAGKSLLMLELAVALSRGAPVLGGPARDPMRVLYVDFENDPRGDVRTRLKAMGMTPFQLADLVYLSFPSLPYLDTPMGGLVLLQVVEEYNAQVVVIDTISRAVGGDENDNDTWLRFYRHTGVQLKGAGVTCIRLDHTGKDLSRGMRGGSAKEGDVDIAWSMVPTGAHAFRLVCTAHRLPVDPTVLTIKRVADPHLHHEIAPTILTQDERVANLMRALDDAGVPLGMGRPAIEKWAAQRGIDCSYDVARDAARKRKAGEEPGTVLDFPMPYKEPE